MGAKVIAFVYLCKFLTVIFSLKFVFLVFCWRMKPLLTLLRSRGIAVHREMNLSDVLRGLLYGFVNERTRCGVEKIFLFFLCLMELFGCLMCLYL